MGCNPLIRTTFKSSRIRDLRKEEHSLKSGF